MKNFLFLLTLSISLSTFAQSVPLLDYENWETTDIADLGLTKEQLFTEMSRDLIKLGESVCANRAMVWLYDFKRNYNVDGSKIFLFYTPKKTGDAGETVWWYHVAPIIVEKGQQFVMDGGFGNTIKKPISVDTWLKRFAGSTNCKEISAKDTDLLDKMFRGRQYPTTTSHGTFDCYYKKAPAGYWTPASVAMNLLGKNAKGETVDFQRPEMDVNDVFAACKEAVTSNFSIGGGVRRCKKYLGL